MRAPFQVIMPLAAALALALPGVAPGLVAEDEPEDATLGELEAERLEKITAAIEVLEAKGDIAAMIALYRKGLAVAPSDPTVRGPYIELGSRLAGYALSHKADPALVLELLDEYETYAGDRLEAPSLLWWLRSTALRQLGRTDEADALVQKAVHFKPEDTDYHRGVGLFLLNMELYDEAITELEGALARAETEWVRGVCTWALAAAHLKLEHYEQAGTLYEQAIELFSAGSAPRNYDALLVDAASAFFHLGRFHTLRGRHKETIAANERALELLPDELDDELGLVAAQNLTAIADAYNELDKPKKALPYIERAREAAADEPGISISLGDAHTKLGDDAKAEDAYERAVQLYRERIARRSNSATAYNNLAWFFVTHDRNLDEALKLSKKSLELAPDTDAYLDTLAEIYFRMGERDKAIEWIKKALELDPKPRHYIYFEQQLEKFESAGNEN